MLLYVNFALIIIGIVLAVIGIKKYVTLFLLKKFTHDFSQEGNIRRERSADKCLVGAFSIMVLVTLIDVFARYILPGL